MSDNDKINKEALKYLDDFMQNTDSFKNVNIVDYLIRYHGFNSRIVSEVNEAKDLAMNIVKEGKRLKYLMPATKDSWYVNLTDLGEDVHFAGGHFGHLKEQNEENKKPWNFYTTLISIVLVVVFGVITAWQNNDRKNLKAKIETLNFDKSNLVKHIESLQSDSTNHAWEIEVLQGRIEVYSREYAVP